MKQTGHRHSVLTWLGNWRRFCLLLTLLFVVRGIFVLSILPPLEGWDEYQHIARLAFQDETGTTPAIGDRPDVPHSLLSTLSRFPHSETSRSHTSRFGGRTYGAFWTTPDASTDLNDDVSIFLYQSQQGPLYYRCMTPLYHLLDFIGHPLRTIATLRLVNLLFGAMAIYVALRSVGGAMRPGADRYLLAILISLQPLYLLNTTRVANDAMAVFFGTLFIAILLRRGSRRWLATSFVAGVLLGLGERLADRLGQALVQIARHLADLHQRALHVAEHLGDLFGAAQLELLVELLLPVLVGQCGTRLHRHVVGAGARSHPRHRRGAPQLVGPHRVSPQHQRGSDSGHRAGGDRCRGEGGSASHGRRTVSSR